LNDLNHPIDPFQSEGPILMLPLAKSDELLRKKGQSGRKIFSSPKSGEHG